MSLGDMLLPMSSVVDLDDLGIAIKIIRMFLAYHEGDTYKIPEVAIAEKFLEKFEEKEGE